MKNEERDLLLTLSFSEIRIGIRRIGEDLLITVQGGEKPHIGCTVLSVPRPSLTGDGSISATSSILNVIGHKDDDICRMLAEKACRKYNRTVVCTGGFHVDGMTPEKIREVVDAVRNLSLE